MKRIVIILLSLYLILPIYAQENKSFLDSYQKAWEIEDGYYRVMLNGKMGLIDGNGNVIIPCENEQVWDLQDNGNIKVIKNGKIGIYNLNGNLIIPTVYDMVWEFEDGRAKVLKNGKMGFVDMNGYEFIPCQYDQIWDFEDGKARVFRNGGIGYINLAGFEVIPAEYQKIWDFEDGRAMVLKHGKMGMLNEAGVEIVPAQYQKIWDFEDGMAKVLKNGKMGYINMAGAEVIPCQYQYISDFEDGIAKVVNNSNVSYINKNGDAVHNPEEYDFDDEEDETETYEYSTEINHNDREVISKDKDTTKIRLFGSDMDIIADDNSTKLSFQKRSDDDDNRIIKRKKKDKRRFDGHYWGMDLGFNNYLNADGELSLYPEDDFLSLNTGKSIEVSLNLWEQDISLSRKGNIGFVTGLGLTFNNYRFDNPYTLTKDDMGYLSYSVIDGNLDKTKLTTLYLTAPILFELQFNSKNRDGFYISAGGIMGYKLKSHTKVVTKNDGEKSKDKDRGNFNLNDFRYGAQVRIGYRAINLYGTYYLSPMFDKNKAPELYPVSIGVSIYPEW
ncbi:WG repeat-containing protein [Plebeiibacterium sediminum]|uniref:WG repeat-containing protein n=1 Tax=Plebeiibacterium sediminum TaxID=2992112 RepID=A0AAE3M8Y7_9BACT|nr:WG repeat-containing protein [Plebeiobacterium sediminum]MCW3789263.1 WG repeat-containing protein [Plebeiobacterium sediminum]